MARCQNVATVSVDALGAVIKPGILCATKEKTIDILNDTGGWIDVLVPHDDRPEALRIDKTKRATITLRREPGIYTFSVYCEETGDCVRANSNPKVILQ
jgi:hypothetical protein